jgi:hypothetical protein
MALTSLQNQFISASYGQLVQISGSTMADGDGTNLSGSGILEISASFATDASSSIFAATANSANTATSASHAVNADIAASAVSASFAQTASFLLGSIASASFADNATSASFAQTASFALSTLSASYADNALSSSYASFAQLAQDANDLIIQVKNTSGGPIAKGDVLHATGVTGENFNVELADSTDPSKMPGFAIANEAISINASGQAVVSGRIIGISTTGLTAGENVYVNASGGFTGTKPTGSSLIQNIGIVGKVDGTDGELVVIGSGRTNDLPNILEGYAWVGNSDGVGSAVATSSLSVKSAETASFLPADTNLNINSISASNATFTSASIGFLQSVTGSAKIIGDAFIILNNDLPTERYAGVVVQDSGSGAPLTTASFQFDGQTNDWFYEYSDDGGATVDHGVTMFGPEYSTKGVPTYPTNNTILKGDGGHHVLDSTITDTGTKVSTTVPFEATQITASVGFSGNLTGQASTAISASHALVADSALTATSASHALVADSAGSADALAAGATIEDITINGYVINEVQTVTISSNTASLDLQNYNTFIIDAGTATLDVFIDASTAPRVGGVYNILLKKGASGTATITGYSSEFKFSSGTEPSFVLAANDQNLLSAVCFESNILLATGLADFS